LTLEVAITISTYMSTMPMIAVNIYFPSMIILLILILIQALYPPLIILISTLEKFKQESSQDISLSQSIQFAAISAAGHSHKEL